MSHRCEIFLPRMTFISIISKGHQHSTIGGKYTYSKQFATSDKSQFINPQFSFSTPLYENFTLLIDLSKKLVRPFFFLTPWTLRNGISLYLKTRDGRENSQNPHQKSPYWGEEKNGLTRFFDKSMKRVKFS